MNKVLNPAHIAPPYKNRYSHAIEVSAGSRMLFISGTVGVKPDGTVPAEFAAQVETVMQNLTEILKAGGIARIPRDRRARAARPCCPARRANCAAGSWACSKGLRSGVESRRPARRKRE